jgi:hypothetical protein
LNDFVHHDKGSSHTAPNTGTYAEDLKKKLGITIIPNEEVPVKSPDASPIDFYGFGLLQQRLEQRKARTLEGVWKFLTVECNRITPATARRVYKS